MKTTIYCALLFPLAALGQDRIPSALFGIEVDRIYQLAEDGSTALPVKRVTGVQRFLGYGVHLYFEPMEASVTFPYVEYPEDGNEYFTTSYRLYMLPVIPNDASSLEEVELSDWRVGVIEWSNIKEGEGRTDSDYSWAYSFCKSVTADLEVEPEITDFYEDDWYGCSFANEERQLEVTSQFGRMISLSIERERLDALSEAVETRYRQFEMEEIRPYTLPD